MSTPAVSSLIKEWGGKILRSQCDQVHFWQKKSPIWNFAGESLSLNSDLGYNMHGRRYFEKTSEVGPKAGKTYCYYYIEIIIL